jgi:L-threonylcarbamoyladenylate synthase
MLLNFRLQPAVACLARGGIVAYPTEAVYGLGCDPHNLNSLKRLLTLKQREWHKGLILIAAEVAQLYPFILPLSPEISQRVLATWPGAVTWLVPARPEISELLRGDSPKIAVRVTAHPQAAALCHAWGGALVSTSANLSSQTAATTASQVQQIFGNSVDYIVTGELGDRARPSEIRDAITNQVLRF